MMKELSTNSQLFGGNAPFVEELYEQYLIDPSSVDAQWRGYFDQLQQTPGAVARDVVRAPIEESFRQLARQPLRAVGVADEAATERQVNLLRLISAYRIMGSRQAKLDPLQRMDKVAVPELDPKTHGLTDSDMAIKLGTNINGLERATPVSYTHLTLPTN